MVYEENEQRERRRGREYSRPASTARQPFAASPPAADAYRAGGAVASRGAHARRSTGSREVIDARGSIDSRTFNETHEISSTTKDVRDRHAAELDSMSHTSWHSRAGQGFDAVPDAGAARRISPRAASNIGFSGGVMSSGAHYGHSGPSRVLLIALAAVALVLVAVVIFLLVR